MISKVIILPDIHMTDKTPKTYKVVKGFISQFKPDETIILGDFMDVASLSAWDYDKKRKMEGRRFLKEVDCANKELDYIQKYSKKIIYIVGNHENRVDRYLDKNPEMEGMIDLLTVLKIHKRKIEWIPLDKVYALGKCNFVHGLYTNQYHAKKTLEAVGDNIVYGHVHQASSFFKTAKLQKPIMAYSLGCLGDLAPEYMAGKWANWITGFGVMYYNTDNGLFNLYPINIISNKFIFNGVEYK